MLVDRLPENDREEAHYEKSLAMMKRIFTDENFGWTNSARSARATVESGVSPTAGWSAEWCSFTRRCMLSWLADRAQPSRAQRGLRSG